MDFGEWFKNESKRFHCAHMNLEDIAIASWDASRKGQIPVDKLKELCSMWNERDKWRTRMGFDWMYMNAIDDLEHVIEECEDER